MASGGNGDSWIEIPPPLPTLDLEGRVTLHHETQLHSLRHAGHISVPAVDPRSYLYFEANFSNFTAAEKSSGLLLGTKGTCGSVHCKPHPSAAFRLAC